MKKFVQKGVVFSSGVASMFALTVGSCLLLAAILDGFYYREIHARMLDCAGFVMNHIAKDPMYPTGDMMKEWSRENDIIPALVLGAPGEDDSFTVLDGKPHNSLSRSYRICFWDGDRMEFFNSWDNSFTTSVSKHSGMPALYGLAVLAIGIVSFRIRRYFENATSEQVDDDKVTPANKKPRSGMRGRAGLP